MKKDKIIRVIAIFLLVVMVGGIVGALAFGS